MQLTKNIKVYFRSPLMTEKTFVHHRILMTFETKFELERYTGLNSNKVMSVVIRLFGFGITAVIG